MISIQAGQIVRVRSRQYLVEEITEPVSQGGDTQVRLFCLEDDAQGQQLEVFWEREVDAQLVGASSWESVASRGFDNPRYFSAYLHALRWNCVTSTNPKLFQAPYRAGIEVKAYQLEPLRKALLMPRVSLFIADDVGLGKTIEAGLILREMLIRQKIKRVVISCPPSVVRQWQEEMASRFGLVFQVFDRDFVAARRRERGYGINPWTTHTRFIISHALLRDEAYAAPLRDWLGSFSAGSMLILDEAHNAAPASSSKYAIDSQLTKTVRDIARCFEHKLFLSATPHNGHSNSFAALLEILDPQRFCRGVPVRSKKLLDAVMVRRLKQDLREIDDRDFPERQVIPVIVDKLPEDAPELKLAHLLQEYRTLREERLRDAPKSTQTAANLVITSLQKRLLSSIEAFARTLRVHRSAIERQAEKHRTSATPRNLTLLVQAPGSDDDRADLAEEEVQAEEDSQMAVATQTAALEITQQELELLEEMSEIAEAARYQPDGRIEKLVEWIRANLCPDLGKRGATWTNRRVLIFTEYTDTKRYLEQQLQIAIANSDRENERIDTFHGGMGEERREAIKAAFNADPSQHPLRILIATDAAREGVNLQNYCADLFHFDVPWNPSRMEQRNGRIDRKLQRESVVRCHYFVLPQRSEDRVLDVLVRKTATIQDELGSLSPVVEKNISKLLDQGIRVSEECRLKEAIAAADSTDGFLYDELTRACVCMTDDPVPKVIVLGRLSLYGERAARLHDEIITVAAEWIAPEARGRGRLRPLTESEKEDALEVLEHSLATPRLRDVSPSVQDRFQAYAPRDVEDLIPHLDRRAEVLTERAKKKLQERGHKEAAEMKKLLEEQRDRILKREKETQQEYRQLTLDFIDNEFRQLEADRRHWRIRVAELEEDLIKEPERIEKAYQVKADRVEPVGLVYLWPVSS